MISKHRRIFRRSNRRRSKQQLNLNRRRQSKQGKIKKNWRKSNRGGRPRSFSVNTLPDEILYIPLGLNVEYPTSILEGKNPWFRIEKREKPIADNTLKTRQDTLKNFQSELMKEVANDNKKITPLLFRKIAEKHILDQTNNNFNIKTKPDAWGKVYWIFYSPDLKEYMDAGFSKEVLIRGGVDLGKDENCSIYKEYTLEELKKTFPLTLIKECFKINDIKHLYTYAEIREHYSLDEIKEAKLDLDRIMGFESNLQVIKYYGFTLPEIKEHYNLWENLVRFKYDKYGKPDLLKYYFIANLVDDATSEIKELKSQKPFTIDDLKKAGFEFKDIIIGVTITNYIMGNQGWRAILSKKAAERFFKEHQSLEYATTEGYIILEDLKNAGYNLISGFNNNENSSKFDLIDIFKKGKYNYRNIKYIYELYLKEDPKNTKLKEIKEELDKIAKEKCGKTAFTGARDDCVYI